MKILFSVCRLSAQDEIESVSNLLLYQSSTIEGCMVYITSQLLADPNFSIESYTVEHLKRKIQEYEIYTQMFCLSPKYSGVEQIYPIIQALLTEVSKLIKS